VYPLSFLEFLEFKNFNSSSLSLEKISDWQIKELSLYLDEFLQY
jgi:predicted AAA+ superfamily ATPase